MKNIVTFTFVALLALSSNSSWGSNYPADFTDFFAKQNESVLVMLAGDPVGIKVDAEISYDSFRLLDSPHVELLRDYLSDKFLKKQAIDNIVSSLLEGVAANPGCDVTLEYCKPVAVGGEIKYVFDFDNTNLKLFVGTDSLSQVKGVGEYHTGLRKNNALINQASIYAYADEGDGDSLNLSNITTFGLPYGYVRFNTQYSSVESGLDVYQGVYDVEFNSSRAVIGYSERRDRIFFNTTDFLNLDADFTSFAAQVGSSRNLVRGGTGSLQSLFFFAPQAGLLEVYQGERLLFSRVVSEGRQDISYNDLPSGSYDVRLVIRAGSSIIAEEFRQVVNSPNFSIPVGDYDYVFTMGRFDNIDEEDELSWLKNPDKLSKNYLQYRTSWRWTDNTILAASATSNKDDSYYQLGLNYMWSDWLRASYQGGLFSSDERYQSATLGVGPLFFSASRFNNDSGNRSYRLSSKLYGEESFVNYSANYSTALWGGSAYLNYSYYGSDQPYSNNGMQYTKGDNVSLGWSSSLWGGQLSLNTTYNRNENYDDFRVGGTWSYVLGNSMSSVLSMNVDKSGVSRTEASLNKSVDHEQWSGIGSVSTAWQPDGNGDTALSGSLNGRNEWFDSSIYGYVSNSGSRMFSGSLTGSQFISSQGAGLTNEMSSSFIHVAPTFIEESQGDMPLLEGIQYNIRKGTSSTYHGVLADNHTVIPLAPYTDMEFSMAAESRNVEISKGSVRGFVYPSSVYTVDAGIAPLESQNFVLNDMDGRPVTQVKCVGDGCGSVERLSDDGVFRVNYRVGGDVKLISANRVCINEPVLRNDGVVYSSCLPGLDGTEDWRVPFVSTNPPQNGALLYLGRFEQSQNIQTILDNIEKLGLTPKKVTVGNHIYLYVHYIKELTVAQRTLLESFGAYIVLNEIGVDELLSAR